MARVLLFNTTRACSAFSGSLKHEALYHMDGGVTDGPRLRQRNTIGGRFWRGNHKTTFYHQDVRRVTYRIIPQNPKQNPRDLFD